MCKFKNSLIPFFNKNQDNKMMNKIKDSFNSISNDEFKE